MKVFFDECVPKPLTTLLSDYKIETAQEIGWGRKKNGELLKLAEDRFDIFVTTDQNLKYQQNLKGRKIAILVLIPNTLSILRANHPQIAAAIASLKPAQYMELSL